MKKLITFALAAVLGLSMSISAFAATSITTSVTTDVEADQVVVTDKDGNVITDESIVINVSDLSEKREEAKAALEKSGIKGAITHVVDVTTNDVGQSYLQAGGSFRITLLVPGAKSGDTYKLLHQKADGTWEVLDAAVGNGTVTATFTSLSPVVIVKVSENTTQGGNTTPDNNTNSGNNTTPGDNTNQSTNTVASPKTGDYSMFGIFAVMAVCAAGLVVVNRRKTV